MSNFKPKVLKFAQKIGVPFFNKNCFFTFRTKYKDEGQKSLGKIYTVICMCLDKDTNDASLAKFSKDFKTNMSEKVFNEPQYMKIQNYRINQNVEIQYFDPMQKFDMNDLEVPDFYTSFAREGLVLNKDKNYDPLKVKFSFRFDQVVDCTPFEAASLKKILHEKIAELYKPDKCCVSYLVDWQMKGVKNMFCSMQKSEYKCKIDIKVFQSTVYEYCIDNKIFNFKLLLKKNNGNLSKAKLYFLETAGIIKFLEEIITKDLENFINPNSALYNDIVELKKDAKEQKKKALKLFEAEINADEKEKIKCKEILEGALDKKPEVKVGESTDFESIDRAQEKAENSNGAQSLKLINKFKKEFCQELKDNKINSDKPEKDDKEKDDKKKR